MIVRLPDEVVRRIAAGEVVDHPSSVVKELIENAIDAHASKVKISISNGGKSLITVEDDGDGMTEDDLKMVVLPHTTSKIKNFDDIFNLTTFGFRGEAISSIAAVSKMKIESANSDNGTGYAIEVIGGIVGETYPVSKSKGTRVSVIDLFFNVPARRKFLSSTSVEARMVTEIVEKFILSSRIAIELSRDGESIYKITDNMTLEDRIKMIFGNYDLIPIDKNAGGMRIHGFISAPDVGRQNRLSEVIFVNGRYVKSPFLMKAIEAGYAEHLKKGEFPMAVIFVEVPPQTIDVNVHPQKLEVKFSDQSRIFGIVAGVIKESLASPDIFKIPTIESPKFTDTISSYQQSAEESPKTKFEKFESESFDFDMTKFEMSQTRESLSETHVMGIVKGRYLVTYSETAIYIIDIHAAHERIIFDRIKSTKISSQNLVDPIRIELNKIQMETFEDHKEEIRSFGFEFKDGFLVSVPSFKIEDWKETFISTIENFRISFARDPKEEFFADLACKMAVKTGERISDIEIKQLLSDIDKLKVWSCPHGRPLVYSIELKRLDRFFGR
ncbi:DNA mismatch repair endonuclease MutL [Athalassotoga saccharophila]|uniref:DNA mismatch repair endonuclease MutL n=1 Tax=Athalassotoga saccharophila TaxID=1441386 RepID=UPI00137AEA26|nr:DNA mismatch repair endonuclease MutL [Athalassotoga saccharophila]BBJ27747.1 DNA mismatch repair protein MutL [Athalassotoga saccharophila]